MRRQRATGEDLARSLEQDGTQTDVYRVVASKAFGRRYEQITEQQRLLAKRESVGARYMRVWP